MAIVKNSTIPLRFAITTCLPFQLIQRHTKLVGQYLATLHTCAINFSHFDVNHTLIVCTPVQ